MSDMTQDAVAATWEQTGQNQQFQDYAELTRAITVESERLDGLIGDLFLELRDQGIARYRQDNQGHHPPFLETVQIGNRARSQAEEIILQQELGEGLEKAIQGQQEEAEDENWRTSPDRWRTHVSQVGDPSPEMDALTDEVWPERSVRFRAMAGFLMQTRYEDSEPIPETPEDPLKAQFTAQVDAVLDAQDASRSGATR
ncbi:hypothetical protein [Dietzia cinnamea]|uniref:hypothetical protein n=1 Tax=Dietzia cinnamea TaxID=321318 RepID=UPI000774DBA6|nr:hypothetical protein [Dietzia cinnamea]